MLVDNFSKEYEQNYLILVFCYLKLILSLLLIGLLCGTSCEKYKEKVWTELPPETQVGANTIGCLVDGKLWATSKLPGYTLAPRMVATYTKKNEGYELYFVAEGHNGGMACRIVNPKTGNNTSLLTGQFDFVDNCKLFKRIDANLYIDKLDISKGIVSGNFTFDIPCEENKDNIIQITKGRFDMRMSVYE